MDQFNCHIAEGKSSFRSTRAIPAILYLLIFRLFILMMKSLHSKRMCLVKQQHTIIITLGSYSVFNIPIAHLCLLSPLREYYIIYRYEQYNI